MSVLKNLSYVCFQNDAQGHHREGHKRNVNMSLLILKIHFFSLHPPPPVFYLIPFFDIQLAKW